MTASGAICATLGDSFTTTGRVATAFTARTTSPSKHGSLEKKIPRVVKVHDRVMARPRIERYLNSERRLSFNENGIFRHYPELDD